MPQTFLVKSQRADGWVEVLLPVRPNGSTGWVQAADVSLSQNPYRIAVHSARTPSPSPTGTTSSIPVRFAVGRARYADADRELLPLRAVAGTRPERSLRAVRVRLSSHSDALETFAGGDAEIGIHGNNDSSALGQSVSHGCIRMDNAAITDLATKLPLGTPVDVTA